MASDIKLLDGDQVLVEGADLVVDRGQAAGEAPNSVAINLKNSTGFWHISGPRTYEDGNPLSIWWHDNKQFWGPLFKIDTKGNVNISQTLSANRIVVGRAGIAQPVLKLDVDGRMRVRQASTLGGKPGDTAGVWFNQTQPAKDQAFVGMNTDTQVGFWGNTGAGWGLVMDTTTGYVGIGTGQTTPVRRLQVEGSEIHSGGSGAGFSFGDRKSTTFVDKPTKGERWVWYSDNGNAHLWSGKDKLSVSSGGNVGIEGDVRIKGGISTEKGVDITGGLRVRGIPKVEESYIAPTFLISADFASGNVGIGTDSPKQKLDVAGNVGVTGALSVKTLMSTESIRVGGVTSLPFGNSIDLDHKSIVLAGRDLEKGVLDTSSITLTRKTILIKTNLSSIPGVSGTSQETVVDLVEEIKKLRTELDALKAKVKP